MVSVPPTDVQAALAWAAGSSVGELSLLGQHHVKVLADEVRYLQAVEDSLLDETGEVHSRQLSPVLESSGGLQTWEKVMLVVMGVVGLVAGADLLWVLLVELALEGGAP
jgi:hypothetical protein